MNNNSPSYEPRSDSLSLGNSKNIKFVCLNQKQDMLKCYQYGLCKYLAISYRVQFTLSNKHKL